MSLMSVKLDQSGLKFFITTLAFVNMALLEGVATAEKFKALLSVLREKINENPRETKLAPLGPGNL